MSQIKHFWGWVVVLSLLLALVPLSMAAANGATVSIDAPDGGIDAGSSFVARVNVTEVLYLDSFQLDVTYDTSVIEVSDVTAGMIASTTLPTEWNVISPEGTIRVLGNLPGVSGVSGSGYLAEIHFYAVGSDGSTSNLTLSQGLLFDYMGDGIPVTDWLGDSVNVAGTATQPIIAFSPYSLSFSAIAGGDNPQAQTLKIWNSGIDTLNWELSDDADWLSLSPTSGSSTGAKDEVAVSVDVTGMTADDYDATVSISAPETTTRTVSVKLYISGPEEPPEEPPEMPAGFSVSSLQISPEQVRPDQEVKISVTITNTGGETGSHTATLYINDELENSRTVSISPGSSQSVTFTVAESDPGTYKVSLGGQVGQFTVAAAPPSPNGLGTGTMIGIIAIIVLIVAIILVLVRARRRQA